MSADQTILRLARKLLGLSRKDAVTVVLARGNVLVVSSEPGAPAEPPADPGSATNLKDLIARHLTRKPQSLERLAAHCGYPHNRYFREVVKQMVDADPPRARRVSAGIRSP